MPGVRAIVLLGSEPAIRRTTRTLGLAILLLGGCPKPVPQTVVPAPVPVGHPDLVCPPGTVAAGTPPPLGIEVWCQKLDIDGRTWLRNGPSLSWYRPTPAAPEERRSSEGSYVDGQPNGPWIYWYENGNPKSQGTYAMGVKEGSWTTFHVHGGPAAQGQFVRGVEQGTWQFWDAETTWRSEGEYVYGQRDGLWLEYGAGPEPVRERVYRNGQLVTVREL